MGSQNQTSNQILSILLENGQFMIFEKSSPTHENFHSLDFTVKRKSEKLNKRFNPCENIKSTNFNKKIISFKNNSTSYVQRGGISFISELKFKLDDGEFFWEIESVS